MRGFSLIELLVVLAIIAILASISYPLYTNTIRKSHRSGAKTALMTAANTLERFRIIQGTYAGANLNTLGVGNPPHYQLNLHIIGSENYLLSATPIGPQAQDIHCGQLSLGQNGQKQISGTGPLLECW